MQIKVDLEATSQLLPLARWHTEVFTGSENKDPKNSTLPEAEHNSIPLSTVSLLPPTKSSAWHSGPQDKAPGLKPLL